MPWNASFGLLFGGGFLFIPLFVSVVLFAVMKPPWDDWILDRRGKQALATPYAVVGTGSSVNDEDVMAIRVTFVDARGAQHNASVETASGPLIARGNQRQPISIEYDPLRPSRVRLLGGAASEAGVVMLLPLAMALLLGAPFFSLGGLWALRARSVYRHGIAVLATVTRHEATASSQNDETVMRMIYTYETARGRAESGWKTVHPAPVGARIWVLHHPRDVTRSVPVAGWDRTAPPPAPPPPPAPGPSGGPRMYV